MERHLRSDDYRNDPEIPQTKTELKAMQQLKIKDQTSLYKTLILSFVFIGILGIISWRFFGVYSTLLICLMAFCLFIYKLIKSLNANENEYVMIVNTEGIHYDNKILNWHEITGFKIKKGIGFTGQIMGGRCYLHIYTHLKEHKIDIINWDVIPEDLLKTLRKNLTLKDKN